MIISRSPTSNLYCLYCADNKRGCCWNETIVLTQKDVERIEKYGWLSYYDLTDLSERKWADEDPLWQFLVTAVSGKARVLKRQSSGSCLFLDSHGCSLPMNIRPLVCRLYPYDRFTQEELPVPKQEDVNCPSDLFSNSNNVANLIGVDRKKAKAWHKQLYVEIKKEQDSHLGYEKGK